MSRLAYKITLVYFPMKSIGNSQVLELKIKIIKSIENEMTRRSLSQGEVARMIGMDRRNVNKVLLDDEGVTSLNQLVKIANGIGLNVEMILKRKKE